MTIPGFYISEEELSLNVPQDSDLIVGLIGPASKGDVGVLNDFLSEPNFVEAHGRPVNRHYGPRAGIRFLQQGNRLKYVRVAGSLLSYGSLNLYGNGELILVVSAASPGSWANGDVTIGVTQNSPTEYNLRVYYKGRAVSGEYFQNLTNGDVATKINGVSSYITVAVASGAGTTAPDETRDPVTGALVPLAISGGDDGAFASTRAADSSTGGIAGKRFYGMNDAVPGSRVFHNIRTIGASEAGLTEYRGNAGMPVQPGTFVVRVQSGAGPAVYQELTDDEDDTLASGMAYNGVGLLRDAGSVHRGFINYRTGEWGVQLNGGPTGLLGGTIDGIWVRGRSETAGATLSGQASYAGALASPEACPGSVSCMRVQFHVPMADTICTDSGIAAAQHDSADPNCQVMDGYLVPGGVSVTAPTVSGTQTVYDDGFGGWRTAPDGGGTPVVGTLNYRTGAWDITFPVQVPANSPITAAYEMVVSDAGGNALAGNGGTYRAADQVCTNATGGAAQIDSADLNCTPMANLPIVPGSVRFVCSDVGGPGTPETVYDDGVGGLCTLRRGDPNAVDVVGSIDYATGAWDITFSGNVQAGATIDASYVDSAESLNVHALRGSAGRMDNTDPAAGNNYKGLNWLDYQGGTWAMAFSLGATKDVQNNGAIYAVYQHGELLGWGDGTTTAFSGTIEDAPLRSQSDRALAFQAGSQFIPAAGTTQMAKAVAAAADYWDQNVAGGAAANPIDFSTGVTQVTWSAAPYNGEAVFVVSEEVVGHVTCQWTGSIGNERATISDGLYAILDQSPTDATKLRFRVMFNDGTGSVAVESWDLLDDFADLVASVNATDGTGSNLVTIEDSGLSTEPDVAAQQDLGMAGAFTNADIIGAKTGSTYSGLHLFQNTDVVAVDVLGAPGQWHRQIADAGVSLCEEEGRRALWLFSFPDFTTPEGMDNDLPGVRSIDLAQDSVDFTNGHYNAAVTGGIARPNAWVPYPPLSTVDSDYTGGWAFYLNYYCQYSDQDVWEGPEGDFAQLLAKTDRDQERWFPVAGLNRGKFKNVNTVRYSPDRADRTLMYDFDGVVQNVVNPIRYKEGAGIFIDGQRTMDRTAGARDRLNARLLLNKLGNLLELANMRYEFELADPILWRQVEATGRLIVQPMIAKRGLYDAELVCDKTTNTAAVIDDNSCVARLMLQITKAAEKIFYDIIIVPTGVSFEEVLVGS